MRRIEVDTFEGEDGLWHIALRENGKMIAEYGETFPTQQEAELKAEELVSELDDPSADEASLDEDR
jgi:hypothetical protein